MVTLPLLRWLTNRNFWREEGDLGLTAGHGPDENEQGYFGGLRETGAKGLIGG